MWKDFYSELKRRNVVRVSFVYIITAWLLMQVVDVMFPAFHMPPWTVTFVASILIMGFPLAIIFAWAYELTDEGIKRESEVERSDRRAIMTTGRKLDVAIIILLVIGLTYTINVIMDDTQTDVATDEVADIAPAESDYAATVAVLPFVNMSSDAENEYFSDGISEEILNMLVKVDGLRVPSRTSSFAFKGQEIGILDIAKQLKVEHILEGSVRKSGAQVRVTAQLIDVTTDTHIWSETYDRSLEDIFAIQEEISNQIVGELKVALGTNGAAAAALNRPTTSTEAYQDYLQARFLFLTRGGDNLKKSIELFEKAIGLDSRFARAHAGLAKAWSVIWSYTDLSVEESQAKAVAAAKQALLIDPSLAGPYGVLAWEAGLRYRWAESMVHYQRATELDPNDPTMRLWHGIALSAVGYLRQSRQEFLRALDLDPISGIGNFWVGTTNQTMGRRDQVFEPLSLAWDMGFAYAGSPLALYYLELNEYDKALQLARDGIAGEGNDPAMAKPWLDGIAGTISSDEAAARIKKAKFLRPGNNWTNYADVGALDETFEALNIAVSMGSVNVLTTLWNHRYSDMRRDPRFEQIVIDTKMLAYWKENGWPDLCRPAGDSFECD